MFTDTNSNGEITFQIVDVGLLLYRFFGVCGSFSILDRCDIIFTYCWQDKWEKYADTGESVDISEDMSLLTLDTILRCAFSYKSNCQVDG